ncbi:hypothetical protein SAMN06269185_1692 [Natronoarchaeum philippinense]|uniref:Uncharacterized protein n=1 Tax=Natronoarchaeum philippinense TaxID=558529 RepID=A0A285NWX8_NATPI|nr:hypothetical protein [Natronoarchaeum philippinense]SNZ12396.1 hypothetical protein SAMN06269185_1692 [Natronoarchaeum philippinense]
MPEEQPGPELATPLRGTTLVTGPSNVGKTRLTAQALEDWIDERGADGVVVLEFAPEIERDGVLLGGRLDRFVEVPSAAFHGVLAAHAPRSEGDDEREARALAADNAERALELLRAAPADPAAVFVNDATIPFQAERTDPDRLCSYCDDADAAVLNAFESDELGADHPVTSREQAALDRLVDCVGRHIRLGENGRT